MQEIAPWLAFNAFVLALLALDLFVVHRRAHAVSLREAAAWSAFWVVLALAFAVLLQRVRGGEASLEYLTGYLIEKALSVDNIFVFVLIFSYFRVPATYQHRVLFWGVLGALVMRGVMIGAGAYLTTRFHWILYLFGAFLVVTGIRMALQTERTVEPEANPVIRLLRRLVPVSADYHGQRFFVRDQPGPEGRRRWLATPLLVVLVMVEATDLVFAVDSIPAVFAVTTDPFLVYTSNVFAILGLRALYFLLAGVVHRFHYLKLGLSLVLVLVGGKMLLAGIYHVPVGYALLLVAAVLGASIVASILFPKRSSSPQPSDSPPAACG